MRRLILVCGVLAAWWWLRDSSDATDGPETAKLQAAVLGDGFALHVAGQPHRVIEVDRQGKRVEEHTVRHNGEIRVVGTSAGVAAGWLDSKKLRLWSIEHEDDLGVWGKNATTLCDGVATHDERFAVGWLESDGRLWFVHGPTRKQRTLELDEPVLAAQLAKPNWCGIASAEDNIALFWRDRDRLLFNTCTKKKCGGLASSIAFHRDDVLLGFGCLKSSCLLAARNKQGESRLVYVTESGSTKWTHKLDTKRLAVSIVGAGNRAFAVGFATGDRVEVLRVERPGKVTKVWQGSGAVPALAWSRDQLFIGHSGGASVVAFPR